MRDLRNRLSIVLVEPEGAINFGFILRLIKNFGINSIYLINPKFEVHGKDRDEICEFAAKACDLLDSDVIKFCSDLLSCLKLFDYSICTTAKGFSEHDVLRQAININYLRNIIPSTGKIALVFGRESVGLRRDELSLCDVVATIDTGTDYPTMNLSHVIAVILYVLLQGSYDENIIFASEAESSRIRYVVNIIKELEDMLEVKDASLAFKHVLFRAKVTKAEISLMYKLFKKIKYAIKP